MIYLDYAATTPMAASVSAILLRYLDETGCFANPSSTTHRSGLMAADAVLSAREQIAALIAAPPESLIFTSGATESINLAIKGVLRATHKKHLITTATAHKATLDTCHAMLAEGCRVTVLIPNSDGCISEEALRQALTPDTALVCLTWVNNETGVVDDIHALTAIAQAQGAVVHVDAVQAPSRMAVAVGHIDLMSLTAHKIYGPKGVGVLYRRRFPKIAMQPLLHGGGQQQGLRAGTLPVHQIMAMAEACTLLKQQLDQDVAHMVVLEQQLLSYLMPLGGIVRHGQSHTVAGIINIGIHQVHAGALMSLLVDLAFSAGSACSAADNAASHVLTAMGVDITMARSSIRLSLGRNTTAKQIDIAGQQLAVGIAHLRAIATPALAITTDLLAAGIVLPQPSTAIAQHLYHPCLRYPAVGCATLTVHHHLPEAQWQLSLWVSQQTIVGLEGAVWGDEMAIAALSCVCEQLIGQSITVISQLDHRYIVQQLALPASYISRAVGVEHLLKQVLSEMNMST